MKTLLYDNPLFEKHETGKHPECAARLAAIRRVLVERGLIEKTLSGEVRQAKETEITRVHTLEHYEKVKRVCAEGGGRLDADTVASTESFKVALSAAGTAVDAVNRVIAGDARQALCLVRPPGHHAVPTQAMGFCLFGNIAVAAAHAKQEHEIDRILIIDWDVHHGNGTQDIFYEDAAVHFFSVHRSPFYPGTGDADETGTGDGLGTTHNLPLKFGISRKEYLAAVEAELSRVAEKCKPQLVLVSAGFDAHAADPIGSLGLETEDFVKLTSLAKSIAATHADGRLVSLLEGGYNLDTLGGCVAAHLEELLANS